MQKPAIPSPPTAHSGRRCQDCEFWNASNAGFGDPLEPSALIDAQARESCPYQAHSAQEAMRLAPWPL